MREQPYLHEMSPCPGIWLCRTPDGLPVLQIRYWADPDKDAEWAKREKPKYTNQAFWEKEMEGNAHALDGQRVYPDFDAAVHVIPDSMVPEWLCCFMSIDPHPRTPHAALWVGIDQWGDWYVYRELWPSVVCGMPKHLRDSDQENIITVKQYCETIAWLEQNSLEWFHEHSPDEYAIYRREPGGENIIYRFMDQAGKAFKATDEAARTESYSRRYDRYGIQCSDPRKSVRSGEDAVRELLAPRRHEMYGNWPKLHVAESCRELILEFQRYRYKSTRHWSEERELKQEGVEARAHQLDNLRYLACADGPAWIPSLRSNVANRRKALWNS